MRSTRNILFICIDPFMPASYGGAQRNHLIYQALCEIADVDLFVLSNKDVFDRSLYADFLDTCNVVGHVPLSPAGELQTKSQNGKWRGLIRGIRIYTSSVTKGYKAHHETAQQLIRVMQQKEYDCVVVRYLTTACKLDILKHTELFIDADDLPSEVLQSRENQPGLAVWKKWLLRWRKRQMQRYERQLLSRCKAVWVTKKRDQQVLTPVKTVLLPNIPYLLHAEGLPLEPTEGSSVILFLGHLGWMPNIRGVDYFIRECWPEIRRQIPEAIFRLAGFGLKDEEKQRWSQVPGVDVVGFVDQVRDAYRDAAFTVAPLSIGGGTNIKVLESLAYGRTVVLTPHAARGFEDTLGHEQAILIASNRQAMIDNCVALLKSPHRRHQLAEKGFKSVQKHYSFESFKEVVQNTIRTSLSADKD